MIRTTRGEMEMLRRGATRVLLVPKSKPRRGAKKARCRWLVGRDYDVMTPATYGKDGKLDKTEERIRCIVHAIEERDDVWALTLRSGKAEIIRYLRATPGAMAITKLPDGRTQTEGDGDYTQLRKSAIPDEPEPVDEATIKRYAEQAREAGEHRRSWETRRECDLLRRTIDDLTARTDIGAEASKRLARMRRDLSRLERELRAA